MSYPSQSSERSLNTPEVTHTKITKVVFYVREFFNETFENYGQIVSSQSCAKSVSTVRHGQVIEMKFSFSTCDKNGGNLE